MFQFPTRLITKIFLLLRISLLTNAEISGEVHQYFLRNCSPKSRYFLFIEKLARQSAKGSVLTQQIFYIWLSHPDIDPAHKMVVL